MVTLKFYPVGNGDTSLIHLADDRLILVDYANQRIPTDKDDKRIDLPVALRNDLKEAGQKDFDVVCFSHLDNDHVKGAGDFFYLEHADKYKVDGRPKIKELWVPAAAITETGIDDDARIIRQEARHRLIKGKGIKVFSRPESLKKFLEQEHLSVESRKDYIVDAGKLIPGFKLEREEAVEFFLHCPFAWRTDEGLEDRNPNSIVFQATFREGKEFYYAIYGGDIEHETIAEIVQTTKRKKNESRLTWDVLHLFHHCSYKSIGPDKGDHKTVPIPDVKWLFEDKGKDSCIIVSPSQPIPKIGTKEDDDKYPPHRQAANYYKGVMEKKKGDFVVTMEHPTSQDPETIIINITATGTKFSTNGGATGGMITSGSASPSMTKKGNPGGNFA